MLFIGFDCDECIAQVEKLMPFTKYANDTQVMNKFIENIVDLEIPFIRPSFWPVFEEILLRKENKKQVKTFIYSNNSCIDTLEVINKIISLRLGIKSFFDEIAGYHNTSRTDNMDGQYVKTWDSMKKFIFEKFNVNAQPNQVMFFDDLAHKPLQDNLSNYVRVKPYYPTINRNYLLNIWENSGGNNHKIRFYKEGTHPSYVDYDESNLFLEKVRSFLKRRQRPTRRAKRRRLTAD